MQPTQQRYGSAPAASDGSDTRSQGHAPGHNSRSSARYGGAIQTRRDPIQRYAGSAPSGDALTVPEGSGQPLPVPLQNKMEKSFDTDFSDVRVHADSPQPRQVGALAFTRGSDVAFAPGMYAPETQIGQELIGHELTHVVQQASGRVADPNAEESPVNDDPGFEQDADVQGARAARGESAEVSGAAREDGAQRSAQPAVQTKRGPIQAWGRKSRKKSTAKAVGKGLINAVFPIFTWKDFFEGIDNGWSKEENPLLGKSAAKNFGIRALILLKELGQLTVGLATTAATIFGIAAIFAPYLAPVAALCGLIATIAHAVTFVLRAVYLGLIGGKLSSLANAKSPEAIAAKKKLEATKWSEIGGLIGNGIGVIFGGFSGAFGGSPSSMVADASKGFAGQTVNSGAQAGTIGAAVSGLKSDASKNLVGAVFGQGGNSLADAFGGGTTRHGKIVAEQTGGETTAPPVLVHHDDEESEADRSDRLSELSSEDRGQIVTIHREVQTLNQNAQHPTVAPPDPREVDEMSGNLDELSGQAQQISAPITQIESTEMTSARTDVSEADAQDADTKLSAHGQEEESGGRDESHDRDASPSSQQTAPPQIVVTPPEDEASTRANPPETSPNNLQVPHTDTSTTARPHTPVQEKPAAGAGRRKPVQAKLGSWFKRKVVNRVKKAFRNAKAKLMAKVHQLLGLDKKAAEAKQQLAQLSAASGEARAAEAAKKEAAAAAAAQAQELSNRAQSSR